MVWTIFLFMAGIALLILGGDFFVSASIDVARKTGLPRIIIGSTLVSLATTTPEFVVTVTASLQGNPHLAVGNAVGSIIANIGLVVGLTATLKAVAVKPFDFNVPAWSMLGAGLLLTFLLGNQSISRWGGLVLMFSGILYIVLDVMRSLPGHTDSSSISCGEENGEFPWFHTIVLFLVGAGMVILGSRFLVSSSLTIAQWLGVPSLFIGLTVVALGTSLPELATALAAFRKGVVDLSLGNVIGANILGITIVVGSAGAISPIQFQRPNDLFSLLPMLVFIIALLIMGRTQSQISRNEGLFLLTLYGMYLYLAYVLGVAS